MRTAWSLAFNGTHFWSSDCSVALPATMLWNVLELSPGTLTVPESASAAAEPPGAADGLDAVAVPRAVVVVNRPAIASAATATGTTEPMTEVADDHALPSAGRRASAPATSTATADSATPMPAVAAETACGPSAASQKAAIATLAAAATPKRAREGRVSAPTARTTCARAATMPTVARAPWRCPDDMANSRTAEPPNDTASRMGSGRVVPPASSRRLHPGAASVGASPAVSENAASTRSIRSVMSPPTSCVFRPRLRRDSGEP